MSDDARGELVPDNYNLNAAVDGELQLLKEHLQRTEQEYCAVDEPFAKGGPLSALWDGRAEAEWRARVEAAGWTPEEAEWRKQAEQRLAAMLREIHGGYGI